MIRWPKKERNEADEVKVMEARLQKLKQSMMQEKQRRAEILQRSGSLGSIWKTGGVGPVRDKKAVEEMVRLESLRRKPSGAVESDSSRASTARRMSPPGVGDHEADDELSRNYHPSSPSSLSQSEAYVCSERPASSSLHGFSSCQSDEPAPTPPPVSVFAEIQTEVPNVRRWEIEVNKRPQSAARTPTYFDKVMEVRRQLQALQPA